MLRNRAWLALGAAVVAAASCGGSVQTGGTGGASTSATTSDSSASATTSGVTSSATSSTSSSGTGGAPSTTSSSTGQGGAATSTASASSSTGGPCMSLPNDDLDQDGYTPAQGDCDDCNPDVHPGAFDFPGNMLDDDCDGVLDNAAPACDQALAVDDADPANAVKAVDLCKFAAGPKDWGVMSAKWTMADGTPPPVNPKYDLGHGILTGLGPNVHVQAGNRFLGLSSGTARQPTDPGYQDVMGFDKGLIGNPPPGLPDGPPSCPGLINGGVHDPVALEVALRAPSNAHGFSFDLNFFSYEWPAYICSQYDDVFAAFVSPAPMGSIVGNIALDPMNDFIGVNCSFIDVCGCMGNPPSPCLAGGKSFACSLGDKGLAGTGYMTPPSDDHGSTGWLVSAAPITPGQTFTIRWTDYDSGDGVLDSTALIDDWQWLPKTTPVSTTRILAPK
jgi:Putative metal-binding motif